MKLLKFKKDWADELYAYGLRLMTDEEYQLWRNAVESVAHETIECYFGTHEGWDDELIGDFLSSIQVVDLTTSEGNVFEFHLPGISRWGYGYFPDLLDGCEDTPEINAYHDFLIETEHKHG